MALQYQQSYLLASSPPGFELLSCNWLERKMSGCQRTEDDVGIERKDTSSIKFANDVNNESSKTISRKEYEFKDTRLDTLRDRELDQIRIREWELCYDCNLEQCEGHTTNLLTPCNTILRKVSFADQTGKQLIQVKTASEPTDVPPTLRQETIEKIKKTLSGFTSDLVQEEDQPELAFNLALLNFIEPHSDLLALHTKVEQLNVNLASISARQGRKLGGTIEIKTQSHESSVYVRFTRDGWKASEDVQARYLSVVGGTDHELYSFEFEVPGISSQGVEIEFAVCCLARNLRDFEYWDNNDSRNYKVLCCESSNAPSTFYVEPSDSHFHRSVSAPADLSLWSMHDLDNAIQPYW